jgi:SulP family sulfate permease
VFYLNRTAHPKIVTLAPDSEERQRHLTNIERKTLSECPQLKIIRIDGSLFFGAVNDTSIQLRRLKKKEPTLTHILIIADSINFIDIAGGEMLVQEVKYWKAQGGNLYLCGLKMEAENFLRHGGYLAEIGENNVFSSKKSAIADIFKHLDTHQCQTCERCIFLECQNIKVISPSSS